MNTRTSTLAMALAAIVATPVAAQSSNPDDATIVGTIVQMGRNLNMDVVAEGVENEEQLNYLQKLDCTYAQGNLFGKPMSSDSYLELLLAQVEGTDTHRALFA
jgi:EAL domain-containing protein (putative c-di-GMP-specific phosphodiesterase class I)